MTTCSRSSFWMSGSHVFFGIAILPSSLTFDARLRDEWKRFVFLKHVVYRRGFFRESVACSRLMERSGWSCAVEYEWGLTIRCVYVLSLDIGDFARDRCCMRQFFVRFFVFINSNCSGKKSVSLTSVLQSWFSALAKTWGSRHSNDSRPTSFNIPASLVCMALSLDVHSKK